MNGIIKKRSKKAGLPPGTLVHIGEAKTEKVKISVIHYDETNFIEKEALAPEEAISFHNKAGITWINVEGIHEPEIIEKICKHFSIHPLVQEDILNTDQRPKVDEYESYTYTVVKMLVFDEKKSKVISEQVSFIMGENYLLSFQEGIRGDLFDPVREQLRKGRGIIRKMKADYLLYSLLDTVVDQYFIILEVIGEEIESLENEITGKASEKSMAGMHHLKRELLFLRKSIWPLREVVTKLEKSDFSHISNSTRVHLRDVYDHVAYLIETIETYREMLSGMLEVFLSSISNRTNQIVKVLTIITTIFMPLTFIAGIYGMNFKYMPELEMPWGYPVVLIVMALIGIAMLLFFKKRRWL